MVILYGTILQEIEGRLLFRVKADCGDAPTLRFPVDAEFWIARRQCVVEEARHAGHLDTLRLPFPLASLKVQTILQEAADAQEASE